MRYRLPFDSVSSIIELDSPEISLPDNIVIAEGDTHLERRNNAVQTLLDQPNVNTVVLLEPQRGNVETAIHHLYDEALGKRMRSDYKAVAEATPQNPDLYAHLKAYMERRRTSGNFPELGNMRIAKVSEAAGKIWSQSFDDANNIKNTTVTQSILSYVPEYSGSRTSAEGFINAHIDSMNSTKDFRLVECLHGSGTVLFDDNDFTVQAGGTIELLNSKMDCWTLAEGSSVLIRTPSDFNATLGARTTVHAHGLGEPDDTPEKRLTVRHDLAFEL